MLVSSERPQLPMGSSTLVSNATWTTIREIGTAFLFKPGPPEADSILVFAAHNTILKDIQLYGTARFVRSFVRRLAR